ncbi:hypothetical protein ADICEAN_01253 [Cesiribacter andamanensis AMV16]|uniref:Uncharacterized protein n=1 Tax=Cesiribacter andamanensis AMV16 TaxID=1279009 RepID=M7N8I0_9BACT|nr:hypothetical protein ADICEAN_01253 [Cesiribacter andamanensis AMV16]
MSQLSRWKKELTPQQIVNILNVLEAFEIDLYTQNIEPNHQESYFST